MNILLLDDGAPNLAPLARTRPVFELRVGALNLRERVALACPQAAVGFAVRPFLEDLTRATWPASIVGAFDAGSVLVLSGRLCGSVAELAGFLQAERDPGTAFVCDGELAAAWCDSADVARWRDAPDLKQARPLPGSLGLLRYPWDLVSRNAELLTDDAAALAKATLPRTVFAASLDPEAPLHRWLGSGTLRRMELVPDGVHRVGDAPVYVGEDVRCKPGVVLDTEDGPIVLAAGVKLQPNAVVQGPAYLGPGCTVNPGAKLREGTSLGAGCKVGGEVEETVMLDFSNKQHDGFLGHAAVGSWVNLGADTNASDLKNNYGPVRVDLGSGSIDTGQRFVGPILGDHVKTGINTMLSTGAVLGVAANVFGGGFPPKTIASFAWGGAEGLAEYDLEKALATAEVVLGRRQVEFTPAHAALLRSVYEETRSERAATLG